MLINPGFHGRYEAGKLVSWFPLWPNSWENRKSSLYYGNSLESSGCPGVPRAHIQLHISSIQVPSEGTAPFCWVWVWCECDHQLLPVAVCECDVSVLTNCLGNAWDTREGKLIESTCDGMDGTSWRRMPDIPSLTVFVRVIPVYRLMNL